MERFLAFLCSICPVCITARLFPQSKFAKKLHEMEKDCPACAAYRKRHAGNP